LHISKAAAICGFIYRTNVFFWLLDQILQMFLASKLPFPLGSIIVKFICVFVGVVCALSFDRKMPLNIVVLL